MIILSQWYIALTVVASYNIDTIPPPFRSYCTVVVVFLSNIVHDAAGWIECIHVTRTPVVYTYTEEYENETGDPLLFAVGCGVNDLPQSHRRHPRRSHHRGQCHHDPIHRLRQGHPLSLLLLLPQRRDQRRQFCGWL